MKKNVLLIDPSPEIIFLMKFCCIDYIKIKKKVTDNDHLQSLCKKYNCTLFIHQKDTLKFGRVMDEVTDIVEIKVINSYFKDFKLGCRYFLILEEMNNLFLHFFGISSKTVRNVEYVLVISNKFIKIFDLAGNILFMLEFETLSTQLKNFKKNKPKKNVKNIDYDKVGRIYLPIQDLKSIRVKKNFDQNIINK